MHTNFVRINISKPLKFLSAGNFISGDENWIHPKRNINHFVLMLVLNDSLYIQQEDVPYEVDANSTLLLLPNDTHLGYKKSNIGLSYYWCHFYVESDYDLIDKQRFHNELLQLKYDPHNQNICIPINSYSNNAERVKILFHQLLHITNSNYYSKYKADYLLTSLIIEISEQCMTRYDTELNDNYTDTKFNRMLEWIRININNNISISQISQSFCYNPDYFSRIFKNKTGMNFTDYVCEMKLNKTKDLLTNTEMSIKEIAYSLGFNDEKYLMKLFKKHVNLTPTQYRNAYYSTHLNNH